LQNLRTDNFANFTRVAHGNFSARNDAGWDWAIDDEKEPARLWHDISV
jgi:hypothetical protein